MRTAILLLALVGLVLADHMFDDFLAKYGKAYSGKEYHRRLKIFRENVKDLKRMQELHKDQPVELGITKFFDMTKDEWRETVLSKPIAPDHLAVACMQKGVYAPRPEKYDMPDSLDWRKTPNVVLSVKDQASCGSCWAFSTVENLEGMNGMNKQPMAGTDLSAQFIVDCSKGCSSEIYMGSNTTVCNGGCNGGWPWTALDDLATGSLGAGVPSWTSYPYTGYTGVCKTASGPTTVNAKYDCVGMDTFPNNEDDIAQYLATYGPLSIAIDADPFYYYSGGIITASMCPIPSTWLDHAVLLVGYDTDATGHKYWIVKNSWGASWGLQGYVYMERGTSTCGINSAVSNARLAA